MDNITKSGKVLYIEDEHFISELYVRALTKAGFETKVILDGVNGLKEARTDSYDLILLDLMVPQITGMDVLRHLRGPAAKPIKAKIVIATNLDVGGETRTELEKLADAYLIKAEITPKELVAFIQKMI